MIENICIKNMNYEVNKYVREAPAAHRDIKSMTMLNDVGIYEFLGIQRTGKSTLMTHILLNILLNPEYYDYRPFEVIANYTIDIDDINCLRSEQMIDYFIKVYEERIRHRIWVIDEASQPPWFYARNTKDKRQTKGALSFWQQPKRRSPILYSDNIGNSVDIQQRDATWFTIIPVELIRGNDGKPYALTFRIIANYEMWFADYVTYGIDLTQKLFDTYEPIY